MIHSSKLALAIHNLGTPIRSLEIIYDHRNLTTICCGLLDWFYDELLNEVGLDESVIANNNYKLLTNRTRVSLMSILDIGGHFLRLLNFIDLTSINSDTLEALLDCGLL